MSIVNVIGNTYAAFDAKLFQLALAGSGGSLSLIVFSFMGPPAFVLAGGVACTAYAAGYIGVRYMKTNEQILINQNRQIESGLKGLKNNEDKLKFLANFSQVENDKLERTAARINANKALINVKKKENDKKFNEDLKSEIDRLRISVENDEALMMKQQSETVALANSLQYVGAYPKRLDYHPYNADNLSVAFWTFALFLGGIFILRSFFYAFSIDKSSGKMKNKKKG